MTSADLLSLSRAVQEKPADFTIRRIYADALEDAGDLCGASWHRAVAGMHQDYPGAAEIWDRVITDEGDATGDILLEEASLDDYAADLAFAAGLGDGYETFARYAVLDGRNPFPRHGRLVKGYLAAIDAINPDAVVADPGDDEYPEQRFGFHGNDTPPCVGEWIGDFGQFGAWVLTRGGPLNEDDLPVGWSIGRWLDRPQVLAMQKRGEWELHADSAGRTYLIDCDLNDVCTLLLAY